MFKINLVSQNVIFVLFFSDFGPPSAHEPDPATDPRAVIVHAARPRHRDGWRAAFRMHLHSTVLYPQLAMVQPGM